MKNQALFEMKINLENFRDKYGNFEIPDHCPISVFVILDGTPHRAREYQRQAYQLAWKFLQCSEHQAKIFNLQHFEMKIIFEVPSKGIKFSVENKIPPSIPPLVRYPMTLVREDGSTYPIYVDSDWTEGSDIITF